MLIQVDLPLSASSPRWPWSTPYETHRPKHRPKKNAKAAKKLKAAEAASIRFGKFLDLSDVCILRIFSYLNESDLFNLDWAYTVKDPSVIPKTRDLKKFEQDTVLLMTDKDSTLLASYRAFAQHYSMVDLASERVRHLISQLPLWKKRQCLTFSNSYHSDRVHWQFTLRNAGPYVETVELRDLRDDLNESDLQLLFKWIDEYCPNLKEISLAEEQHKSLCAVAVWGTDIEDSLLSMPAQLMGRLEALTLTFYQEREVSFDFILLGGFPDLKSLSIRHLCCFDDKALLELSEVLRRLNNNLSRFSCHHSYVSDSGILQFVESLPNMDEMSLIDCYQVDFPRLGEQLKPIMEARSSELRIVYYRKWYDSSPRPISSPLVKFVEVNDKKCPVCPYLENKEERTEPCESFTCERKQERTARICRAMVKADYMDDDPTDDDDSMDYEEEEPELPKFFRSKNGWSRRGSPQKESSHGDD